MTGFAVRMPVSTAYWNAVPRTTRAFWAADALPSCSALRLATCAVVSALRAMSGRVRYQGTADRRFIPSPRARTHGASSLLKPVVRNPGLSLARA